MNKSERIDEIIYLCWLLDDVATKIGGSKETNIKELTYMIRRHAGHLREE